MTKNGYFISDLHLFSRRSHGARHTAAIFQAAADAHTIVLGGDIFDFKWSTHASSAVTVESAIAWIDALVQPHPDCDFHFVLGNHDSSSQFVERLSEYALGVHRFSWHRYYVRIGDALFLHGDVADRTMDQQGLTKKREQWDTHEPRGWLANMLYDFAITTRLHRLAAAVIHRDRAVAKRIVAYLNDIDQGAHNGLRHVYFGHTHKEVSGFEYEGLVFHNGGAPIKGLSFRIVPLQTELESTHG